jgi:hypothetical protein
MKTVKMEVTVTLTPPLGHDLSDDRAIELAMSAVTQSIEVDCGRDIGATFNRIAWAKVHADVSDRDCEVIEGGENA